MTYGLHEKPSALSSLEEESAVSNYAVQVQQGILLLKESKYGDKLDGIDLGRLNLFCTCHCPMGQVGDYDQVCVDLGLGDLADHIDFGFYIQWGTPEEYRELTEEWRKQLEELRQ